MLTRDHSVIRYDWRGCGLSDRDGIEFSAEKYVQDCEAVVEAAQLKPFVMIAMASGATVAIPYAARRPDQVSHLVLWGDQTCGWLILREACEAGGTSRCPTEDDRARVAERQPGVRAVLHDAAYAGRETGAYSLV